MCGKHKHILSCPVVQHHVPNGASEAAQEDV